ncbi:hypothetical protein M8C21_027523 [Ambrosia artemisiifolia]|uniref:Uncharacterized protein n=1 Tax=Ambrosia artemisiifolia TaxID=4212 RepID=A0AAD5CWW6_AMBAR|nr:hypothetical protein M8C21_027523 [Ambrosia artemisiifolia]
MSYTPTPVAELCAVKGDSRTVLEVVAYASVIEQDQNWERVVELEPSICVLEKELHDQMKGALPPE